MHKSAIRQRREDFPDSDRAEAPRTQGVIGQVILIVRDKGYGFLFADGVKYFFHRSGFLRPHDFDALVEGAYLTFEPRMVGFKGPRAERLELA